jgi:orotate phosphoribosyltransferase
MQREKPARWVRTALADQPSLLLLDDMKASGALQFGSFTLASGKTSSYYIDIKRAITRPDLLRTIANGIAPFARNADRIAGVELGAVPIAAAVSLASGKPYIMVRKSSKEHGTKHEFEGELVRGNRVLFVEDVVTTGGTLRAAVERLRGHGAVVDDCVCVVDREEGGKMLLAEISVRLHALLSAKDLLA